MYSEIVSIDYQTINNTISVSPNPMQNLLNVSTGSNDIIALISVYDINGKELLQVNNQSNIDVSKLLNGIYTIKVITDKQTFIKKIVK
jgi:hypothetical protein